MVDSKVGVSISDKILIFWNGRLLCLDGNKAKILRILQESSEGMTAKMLAEKVGITPGGVFRDLQPLVKAGIVEKTPLPASPNVKLYRLQVKMVTKEQLEEMQRTAPKEVKHLIRNLAYPEELVWSLLTGIREFIETLPEEKRGKVVKFLSDFLGGLNIFKNF